MCDAFDVVVKSRSLTSGAIVDPSSLDRRLVSLVQSICRRFLGQRTSSGLTAEIRREIPVGHQDPAISTLLYKSAAVESRENGFITKLSLHNWNESFPTRSVSSWFVVSPSSDMNFVAIR
jgi:hypothetical protein